MISTKSNLSQSSAWLRLTEHRKSMQGFSLKNAFAEDSARGETFSLESAGIFFDYSKHLINNETFKLLLALGEQQGLTAAKQRLFNGDIVNPSENRMALHWLLRKSHSDGLSEELTHIWQDMQLTLKRMLNIADAINNGSYRSASDKAFTDVVHIGIGGSDLGPAMAYQALTPYWQRNIRCHFVSNICSHDIRNVLADLNAETTLFIIASKSFTTLETLRNADSAKEWFIAETENPAAIAKHFFAVSTNIELVTQWGIDSEHIYPFGDFIGGRYSLWSAIGLVLAIGLGTEHFKSLLKGAETIDEHYKNTASEKNMADIMAMLGVWYTNFYDRQSHSVIPYDHRLRRFAAFLQQLEMESNGKQIDLDGKGVDYNTCPDIFGEAGTNSQHSFFQQFHQGPEFTPIDFIMVCNSQNDQKEHRDWLIANCLAQSQALMNGQDSDDETYMPGNRPSSTLALDILTPERLGSLIALYEHKVYSQSVLWHINPFDQWGVQLGKVVSQEIHKDLAAAEQGKSDATAGQDGSTAQLIRYYLKN